MVGGIAGILNIWLTHSKGTVGIRHLSLLALTHLFTSVFLFLPRNNSIVIEAHVKFAMLRKQPYICKQLLTVKVIHVNLHVSL